MFSGESNIRIPICLISKYPPIEGGESSKAYWLAKALGRRGIEVHIVTNAWEVEDDYRITFDSADLAHYQPHNVFVHNTDPFVEPHYIPFSKPFTEKLASYAIEVIKRYNIEIIDSWYILPYVISAYLAKILTGKPQIMRHAGSDMTRLISSPYLNTLFTSIFCSVDKIITYRSKHEYFSALNIPDEKIFLLSNVSVDTGAFHPDVTPLDLSAYKTNIDHVPIITYIGKIGITKGMYELVEAASHITDMYVLLFVTKGIGLDDFKKHVVSLGLMDKCIFMDFVPPWKIPAIIKRSTCVVVAERDFPITQHSPILPREVMAVGKCLIISNEIYCKKLNPFWEAGKSVIVIDPHDIKQFQGALISMISNPELVNDIGRHGLYASQKLETFDKYVDDMITLYREILDKCK